VRALRRILLVAVLTSAVAKLYFLRRYRSQVRVDLYFEDGSLATFGEDDPSGAELLSLARDVRRAAA
jgi:hypothetical protein